MKQNKFIEKLEEQKYGIAVYANGRLDSFLPFQNK